LERPASRVNGVAKAIDFNSAPKFGTDSLESEDAFHGDWTPVHAFPLSLLNGALLVRVHRGCARYARLPRPA
jgi:hypothetical protein